MGLKKKMTDVERIEFAKQIEFFYESTHAHLPKVATFAFIKGLATGLGVFLGGTIVVAILLWILSGLGNLPFLDNLSESAKDTLETTQKK